MNFLPISILAYALNGFSTVIDKILIRRALPNPFIYTFYISILGSLAIFFAPFGLILNTSTSIFSILAGIFGNLAMLAYFQSLKKAEASVVAPVVGSLNPLFTILLGSLFLNQFLTGSQLNAVITIILGSIILTLNLWLSKLNLNSLFFMTISGLFFALSYLFLKEAFEASNFVSGLVISRVAGGVFVLPLLLIPNIRRQIFHSKITQHNFINKTSMLLLLGQSLGAAFGLLLTFGVSLAHPALVNSLFGIQYLVILVVSLTLAKKHPHLLDEKLTLPVIGQKIVGVLILSYGLYLLSQ